tara:strand:- start:490 stop:1074 length:585 start_codon:yes stop_codon:yes gene_type:complete
MKNFILLIFILFLSLSGCTKTKSIFKRADVKDVPINVNDRVKRNLEEGRGIRFSKKTNSGGTFDFASSNELWRASIDVLDFVPFSNASYSGGILITEWFDGNSKTKNEKRDLKITVRFLTNEIRADALDINIHERKCQKSFSDCNVKKIQSKLENEIKLAILKRAAFLESDQFKKNREEFLKKKRVPRSLDNTR